MPTTPTYVAAGPDGAAYFGNGANGTGSNLYRFFGGSLRQTVPAPPPNGYDPGGGVYGITVTDAGSVFWLSAYFGPSYSFLVAPECGGGGGAATLCEPTVDEPTSTLVDASGTFWIGGLSYNGGGLIVTSNNQSIAFNTAGVMQLVNGAGPAVWGVLQDFSRQPAAYSIAQFAVSGSSIIVARNYTLPAADSIASMSVGGDGNFWFADYRRNAIGRMNPNGSLREFPLRTAGALATPVYGQWQIATACDGAVWFTEPGPNKVARIDAKGGIDEFSIPTARALLGPIAAPAAQHGCVKPEFWIGEQRTRKLAAVTY